MLQIVGGKYKRRKLLAPNTTLVRPTAGNLREALFNICQNEIEGALFLDLFAGSGAMGLEAISRGAKHATFVEQNSSALSAIKKNIETLGEGERATVIRGDVVAVIPRLQGPFDIIYVDPPYSKGLSAAVLTALDKYPLLAKEGRLFIEDDSLEEPPLDTLKLKDKRTVGRAILFEYGYAF